jgi:hypothetical protein
MSSTLLTISTITREAAMVLENNLTFTKGVNREYDDKFAVQGAKIGDTVNVRKPPRYVGRTGQTISIENSTETSVPVTLTTQFGVDIAFTSKDLLLNIDDFSKRFIKPAMAVVSNKIDRDGLLLYQTVANATGTPGTPATDLSSFLDANAKLADEACPMDGLLTAVISPWSQSKLVNGLKSLFQSSVQIKEQYEQGNMGLAAGMKFSMDQNVVAHKVGPLGGSPLVTLSGSSGNTLVTRGWTAAAASRLKKGDVFTILNVNSVNPQIRQDTGQLRQFVCTADFSSDSSGNGSVSIFPALTASGQFQTISAMPVDGAAITVLGAANTVSPANLIYHQNAFTLASADMPLPGGVDMAARVASKHLGISVRLIRAYDIVNDIFPCRLDVLYGWAAIYPELACRQQG